MAEMKIHTLLVVLCGGLRRDECNSESGGDDADVEGHRTVSVAGGAAQACASGVDPGSCVTGSLLMER